MKQIKTVLGAVIFSLYLIPCFADNAVTGSGTECVYSTLNTYTGPSTIKANWDPNSINLYWYNDEQKLSVQTASNACDYDSGISLPSSNPTKTGYTFTGWEVIGGAPTGYTLVEYIQATGTQYIDTGIVGKNGVSVEAKFVLTSTDNGSLFGNRMTGNTRFWPAMWYSGKWNATIATDSYNNSPTFAANTVYVTYFVSNSSGWTFDVNGNRAASGTQTVSNTNNLWMFGTNNGQNSPSTLQYPFKGKVYYARIWNNNVLVRNFVPAKRNTDSVVGMYDTVSGTFFTNIGSGSFTAGNVIQ